MTRSRSRPRRLIALLAAGAMLAPLSCGSESVAAPSGSAAGDSADVSQGPATGIRVVAPDEAAGILDDAPADLVVLDVRTPEEFAEGHLDGAVLLDFYAPDFADRLAELDPDVPYLLYCRSGNRSGQARAQMAALGFTEVADIDGGIVGWTGAGLPIVGP